MGFMHTFSDVEIEQQGFQFPGNVEISAMGQAGMGLEHDLPHVLRQLGVAVLDEHISVRLSAAGKYVAVRMAFIAQNRAQYEAAQTALREHPGVKWLL